MEKLSADKSRYSDKKNSTSDENARKRHQHGSANEYPTHPYPSYPYKKSSRKTTWNSEVWRARRPEELKGASPQTAVIYYLLFSVWLMLIAALIYAHCSVPSYFLPVPEKEAKSVDEVLSIMDIVYSTDEECIYIEKYDNPMSLSRGAMESLFCTLNERKEFNFNYLSFGMKRGQIFSQLLFNQSESNFNSIPATRLDCEQKCDTFDDWILEDETDRHRLTFDLLQGKFRKLVELKPPKSKNTDVGSVKIVQLFQKLMKHYKEDCSAAEDVYLLFVCFINIQGIAQKRMLHSLAPVEKYVPKCVVGGSFSHSEHKIIRRNPLDAVVVCASSNRSDFRGVPLVTAVHDDNVPYILVVAPGGARLVDVVAMETFLEAHLNPNKIKDSTDVIRSKGLPYVIRKDDGTIERYIDDTHGYDEVITIRMNMNGGKSISFNGEKKVDVKNSVKPGKLNFEEIK